METKVVNFVGIDISKEKFDAAIIVNGNKENVQSCIFEQSQDGYNKLLIWVKEHAPETFSQTLYCMEHTGVYNMLLAEFLCSKNVLVCLEDANQIKLSNGLQRGKNDKIDAKRIAYYAFKNHDELRMWAMPRKELSLLKTLLTHRAMLVQTKTILVQNINELKSVGLIKEVKQLEKYNKGITGVEKDIKQIDTDIEELIENDENMNKQVKQITSIPGVGVVTASHLIVYTNEFKSINSGKQLACYCGVAPFEHTSGKSVKGKTRVSHAANKALKKLLHMCALSAMQTNKEFKEYYQRKKAEGKNAMSVLNAIRNKIILRIVSLIKNDTMYVDNYVYNMCKNS